ncbi:NADPH:quinone reductase [Burkholderia cepacia]|uniref:NADPH:quinone reductase n=1 Tax=Burkholderia cepacia TaxID=292 RepID=UPI000F5601A6|nr:NADPH:quinone reductase [Burkholderia cepacia]RQT81842.1 NADPH:quinone reductase [Burkholderia cepacia]RQU01351.1 NADPH:quinone reductase [Burkholderia cepacia]RQZ78015.1 NADPH:quinone reductase [Burkholderia cepacia]
MKAAYYERQGNASEVLRLGDFPVPQPGPGEVRVRVHASGLNPSDIKARTGFSGPSAFPMVIPHQDGAGVIDAVGAGVAPTRTGERVWLFEAQYRRPFGTAAEYAVVPEAQAVPLPDNVSFEVGACLGIPALTAHRCLFSDGDIKGCAILVHGGAGAVGTAAILLAKWAGAWVATTVSTPGQADAARRAGADLVINRRLQDVVAIVKSATRQRGVDRIVEVSLQDNLAIDMRCLANGGIISSYAVGSAADQVPLPLLDAMIAGCSFRFVYIYTVPAAAKSAAVSAISQCLADGAYAPTIGMQVALDAIVEAHEAQESGQVIGKIIVTPSLVRSHGPEGIQPDD